MKFKSNEEGKCPICNSNMLEYFGMESEDDAIYYPWHCPDCGTDGKEWYNINFSEIRSNSNDIGTEEGICPECGAEIMYGTIEPNMNSLGYIYFCPNCDDGGIEWYDLDFDSHTIDGHEDEEIELVKEGINYKDDKLNVTTAEDPEEDRAYYGKNMTKRDKVRSLDQAKRNLDRMEKDPRVTQGQAVDQMSFDSALDTDLAYYKHNKDMAKIDKEKGNDFWADEHNKTAKQFADKIRAKHKKQEDIEDDEEENDNDLLDTISLLDMALSEIPTIGVEDWGKDDELLFTADTKILFEHLKSYEHKIPRSYYDNAENDDWSNGIDKYLEDKFNVDIENGESDNTYNWNAPLTHNVEFTIIQARSKCFFKASIHRAGDVRGNYTTEFLLEFNDKDECLGALFDSCAGFCQREIKLENTTYVITPHFFNEYVDIYNLDTDEAYDDVYCDCIDRLKEIIIENKDSEE